MLPCDLVGQVVADRLAGMIDPLPASGRILAGVMGLPPDIATAIAREVAALNSHDGVVDASVHPDIVSGALGTARKSEATATEHRNEPMSDDVVLTLYCVPAADVASVEASVQHVERITDAWLLDDISLWANRALPGTGADATFRQQLEGLLKGLVRYAPDAEAKRVAEYAVRVADLITAAGQPFKAAARAALPALRLPRDSGDPGTDLAEPAQAAVFFKKAFAEAQPLLHLRDKDGEPLDRQTLHKNLDRLVTANEIPAGPAAVLGALIRDPDVGDSGWTPSQVAAAELQWEHMERLFADERRRTKPTFGSETRKHFEARHPTALSVEERALLDDLRSDSTRASEALDDFFEHHRDKLRADPKLYRRWEKLVFRKPIEVADLAEGLLRLATRLRPDNDGTDDSMGLYVRLYEGDTPAFWTEDKNTKLCRLLRTRWRGLNVLLQPVVALDFGKCWRDDWETEAEAESDWEEVTASSKEAVTFRFEGYAVPRSTFANGAQPSEDDLRKASGRAQMFWRPPVDAMDTAFPIDVGVAVRLAGEIPLLTATVTPNRYDRHGALQAIDIEDVSTITDVTGDANGRLADPTRPENRMDQAWSAAIAKLAKDGILPDGDHASLTACYDRFRVSYGKALRAIALQGGAGLSEPALLEQAELYGDLLSELARVARAEVCVRDLWQPMLMIGAAVVSSARPCVLVTACHPLRLAEIAIKARQLGKAIERIMQSPGTVADEVSDYVDAVVATMGGTYYADVGIVPGSPAVLVAESKRLGDVSLLEPPTSWDPEILADEPAEATVAAFERVAQEYLDLRPHEKASFSAVLIDVESENLPVQMANSMAKRIEGDPGLRCDLVLTHDSVGSLRRIYERQNRRIGHGVDTSLTSEAARNFLSRLRVAIVNPETLAASGGKNHDIVVLQDVISRRAEVRWIRAEPMAAPDLATNVPTSQSRRKPFRRGDTTSGAYLSAPGSPAAVQAYVDALHDTQDGRASERTGTAWLPIQEVEFRSGKVKNTMEKAHRLGHWVMTYDRIADRRLVSSDERRILRYFSDPRSDHNVIVSAEVTEQALGERLRADLENALPGEEPAVIHAIAAAIHGKSASISGAIVMRGAQRRNHAQELLGLVLARAQVDLLLGQGASDHRTAWFFLDEVCGWLGLGGGLRADLLAVDFGMGPQGPLIRFTVAEAKFVNSDSLGEQQRRSLDQLDATFSTLAKRLVSHNGTVDPAMWRARIADLVLEHVEPFDHVGGVPFTSWITALRAGSMPMKIGGHSLVFAHDMPVGDAARDMAVPDMDLPRHDRRRIAQWTFGRADIAAALRGLTAVAPQHLLHEPDEWPNAGSVRQAHGGNLPVGAVSDPTAPSLTSTTGGGTLGPVAKVADSVAADQDRTQTKTATSALPDRMGPDSAAVYLGGAPPGWHHSVYSVVVSMARAVNADLAEQWLSEQVQVLRAAVQKEGMTAKVLSSRLTPNSGLVELDGRDVTVSWLEKKQVEFLTKYGVEVIRISPKPGRIAIGIKRPARATLHLADAWLRRTLPSTAPQANLSFVIGEKEDDGGLFYLPLGGSFAGQERAAPHTIISGTTGSGKGIMATSLILDACAFNSPENLRVLLIDPKRGVDYAWVRGLPHMQGGIIDTKEAALQAIGCLVTEMETRYEALAGAGVNGIDAYNAKASPSQRMPRIVLFFDEVANWMQDDEFKAAVEPPINEIATKSRAAGIHMVMIYQRADNQVMTMQLRANLGNKLVLRLGDEGSSKIALGERGAECLLGKGHVIAKLDSDEKVYGQVPFIEQAEVDQLAAIIVQAWTTAAVTHRTAVAPGD